MAYFEWGPDLEIDHGLIDADHRQLVELVNELHTATSQGQGQEVVASVMERLITYTRQHFAREEQGMEARRFLAWRRTAKSTTPSPRSCRHWQTGRRPAASPWHRSCRA